MTDYEDHTVSIRAEQAVLGGLLADNDALDRIPHLSAEHFYREDHRAIFAELRLQVAAGLRADPMTLFEKLAGKVDDCLKYLATLRSSAVSAANITRHAEIVADRATKRALAALCIDMQALAVSGQPAAACVDQVAARLEELAQQKTTHEPRHISDLMGQYADTLQRRMEGMAKPISTGHRDLDDILDGGLERGTLTVLAARPGMGKTAMGLGLARNVARDGVSLFLSMEMSAEQVSDRNAAAIGQVPLKWLRKPGDKPHGDDARYWDLMTAAFVKAAQMRMYIDEQAGMNMIELRAKARKVKRKSGLDLLVVDQLSFITGGKAEKSYEAVGEHTRGLVALAKELDCAVVLLCQLNRECEKRNDKRPMAADLAMSGSIEQDAANILFLYRDDVYHAEKSNDPGICEVISVKQRQGSPGTIGLRYIGPETRFEDTPSRWYPRQPEVIIGGTRKARGFS